MSEYEADSEVFLALVDDMPSDNETSYMREDSTDSVSRKHINFQKHESVTIFGFSGVPSTFDSKFDNSLEIEEPQWIFGKTNCYDYLTDWYCG